MMILQYKTKNSIIMTKEEIKAMIDATINENGERNITGKALNLALNAIVDAMGEGGGGALDTVYFLPDNLSEEANISETGEFWGEEDAQNMLAHNIEIYQKITEKYLNEKCVQQISVDMSLIGWMSSGMNIVANVPASVLCFKVDEQTPMPASWTPSDHYNAGDVAVFITPQYEEFFGQTESFWLQSDGVCGLVNNGGGPA